MTSETRTEGERRGGRVWPWVLAAVLLLLFLVTGVIALAVIVGLSGGSSGSASATEWEETYVTGEGENKIAVLPISGVITDSASGGAFSSPGATPGALRSQLQQAASDSDVKAVILEINSPGGGVVPSDTMYNLVRDFKEESGKPVVVSMGSVAASGGYYISAAADYIVANPSTTTGSIGVIYNYTNITEALDKIGVNPEPLTTGKFKNLASPANELTEAEREILRTQIQQSYDQFVSAIVAGRELSEERVRELGDGRTYTGVQAEDNGLVDELGGLETAAAEARRLAEIPQAQVVRYEASPGLLEAIQARIAPQEPEAIQIMKAAGVDPTPTMQYLYRPGW